MKECYFDLGRDCGCLVEKSALGAISEKQEKRFLKEERNQWIG